MNKTPQTEYDRLIKENLERMETVLAGKGHGLIIIDMQNDFVRGDSPCRVGYAQNIIPSTVEALELFRRKNLPIFHVIRQYRPDGSDVELFRLRRFAKGEKFIIKDTQGAEIIPELTPKDNEYVIVKNRFSSFDHTELRFILDRLNIGHLAVCGVNTAHCVRQTCYDALCMGYEVNIIQGATGGASRDINDSNIQDMSEVGARLVSLNELEKIIK